MVATPEAVFEKDAPSAPTEAAAAGFPDEDWPLLPLSSFTKADLAGTAQGSADACLNCEDPMPEILVRLSKQAPRVSDDAKGGPLEMWSADSSSAESWSPSFPPCPQPVAFRRKKGRWPSHERPHRGWMQCNSGTRILPAGFL